MSPALQLFLGPHPSLEDPERIRRAFVLALATLVLGSATGLLIGIGALFGIDSGVASLIQIAVFAIAYIFSRTARPELGGAIVVFGSGAFLMTFFFPEAAAPGYAIALLLPVLLSTLVMPLPSTLIAAGLTIAGLAAIVVTSPGNVEVIGVNSMTGILCLLAAGTAYLRERDLQTIQSQTTNLESYSQGLEEEVQTRTSNILAIAEIGREIAETRDLQALMDSAVTLIIRRFDFYHAQIFLIDEANKFAVLRASTGTAGKKLLARQHRLEVGSRSVIGQVTARGESVIATDTDTDAIHRRNELLPNTRAEMALPLRASGRVIGALDIQSTRSNAFGQADIPIFQTLADQLAVAIERISLFERTQEDLQRIEILNRQLTGEAWAEFMARREGRLGYRTDPTGVTPIDEADADSQREGAMSLPLRIRGETIGELEIAPRDGIEPDPELQEMLEAVADRVAQALDSTRLSEQSRRQADQEMILSRLSADLQASTDLQVTLRTVAEQASRALGTSRGFVHLRLEYDE